RQQLLDESVGGGTVCGAVRFDQRDGAGKRTAVARFDARSQLHQRTLGITAHGSIATHASLHRPWCPLACNAGFGSASASPPVSPIVSPAVSPFAGLRACACWRAHMVA